MVSKLQRVLKWFVGGKKKEPSELELWQGTSLPNAQIRDVEIFGERPDGCYCDSPDSPRYGPCLHCLEEGFRTANPEAYGVDKEEAMESVGGVEA